MGSEPNFIRRISMPDISAISAVFGSLKTATDIAKFIRESDVSIERAELKLKIADLFSALADVKMELVDLQDTFAAKEQRIGLLPVSKTLC
jgi:hypothetical protein